MFNAKITNETNRCHDSKRVLVCVLCGDCFERTKYILNTAVSQSYPFYEILVVGKQRDIDSFEEMFEILNASNHRVFVNCKYSKGTSSANYLLEAHNIALEGAFDYLCVLPEGVAFYDNKSLEEMMNTDMDEKSDTRFFSSIKIIDNEYVGNCRLGPELYSVNKLICTDKVFGQYVESKSNDLIPTKKNKLKIVMFVTSYSIWPSMKTLYEAAERREDIDIKLVHVHNSHLNANESIVTDEIRTFHSNGYTVIASNDYDLAGDSPDIAIFGLPYSTVEKAYTIDSVSKIVPRCVYVPYGFKLNTKWEELIKLRYKVAMIYLAWLVFYGDDSELEYARKYIYGDGSNLAAIGLPRMDLIKQLKPDSYPEYARKIQTLAKGRKVAMWNTHHSINSQTQSFSSWKLMGARMIDYIKKHPNVFFLWRPHPYFKEAHKKYVGPEASEIFWNDVKNIENIVVDEEQTYLPAFSVSDFMVSDASSLAKEYLYTGKPVVVTASARDIIDNIHPYDCLEIVYDFDSAASAINRILSGEDIYRDLREQYLSSTIKNDTCIGENMLSYIIDKYNTEENR